MPDPDGLLSGVAMVGAVAQLGEHLLCKQGVTGSIPLSSTKSLWCRAGISFWRKTKFASASAGCLFCIYREETIDLEASRCSAQSHGLREMSEPSSVETKDGLVGRIWWRDWR